MSVVYAESSAVLTWLLGEARHDEALQILSSAERVAASTLTLIESGRGILRARALGRLTAAEERTAMGELDAAAETWSVIDVSDQIAVRTRARFPTEPVRASDAIHLATAAVLRDEVGLSLRLLSFDERVRTNARALGLVVSPA